MITEAVACDGVHSQHDLSEVSPIATVSHRASIEASTAISGRLRTVQEAFRGPLWSAVTPFTMAAMTPSTPPVTSPPLTDWHRLRDWAILELAKRHEDATRDQPLYSRSRPEALAALNAARVAYGPFLSIF